MRCLTERICDTCVQALVLHCWHKMAVRGSMEPTADPRATGRRKGCNRQHHMNDQASSERAKTTAASGGYFSSLCQEFMVRTIANCLYVYTLQTHLGTPLCMAAGASLVPSLHAHSSPHAAQGSRQCIESPLQHWRDRSRAQGTCRQSLSGDISRWERRDVRRSATAPQWQRAGSRLQRTVDDEPEPFSAQR